MSDKEAFIRARVGCAVALTAASTLSYGALVVGMAAYPNLLRLYWREDFYSLGMALVASNVVIGTVLIVFYMWWMQRHAADSLRVRGDQC